MSGRQVFLLICATGAVEMKFLLHIFNSVHEIRKQRPSKQSSHCTVCRRERQNLKMIFTSITFQTASPRTELHLCIFIVALDRFQRRRSANTTIWIKLFIRLRRFNLSVKSFRPCLSNTLINSLNNPEMLVVREKQHIYLHQPDLFFPVFSEEVKVRNFRRDERLVTGAEQEVWASALTSLPVGVTLNTVVTSSQLRKKVAGSHPGPNQF